jgi:NAD(P)H-dependent flavin oxidoreductase YrpB (nitropropane dioxygenase family)
LFGIRHPVLLAGMNVAAGPRLAAAVTNAGGLGVIGGGAYTPEQLRETIQELKAHLNDKSAPFGVDLLVPKVGDGARKTKYAAASAVGLSTMLTCHIAAMTTSRESSTSWWML